MIFREEATDVVLVVVVLVVVVVVVVAAGAVAVVVYYYRYYSHRNFLKSNSSITYHLISCTMKPNDRNIKLPWCFHYAIKCMG